MFPTHREAGGGAAPGVPGPGVTDGVPGPDVAVGVPGPRVAVGVPGPDVAVGVPGPTVAVGVADAQPPSETVFVSIVTAPFRARARPATFAPVVREMLVSARMLPTNDVPVPRVAELPTCQKALH